MTRPTKPRRMRSFLAWAVVDRESGTNLGRPYRIRDRTRIAAKYYRWAHVRVTEVVGKGIKK